MEITLLIMEKSWNRVFEFLWEPCTSFKTLLDVHIIGMGPHNQNGLYFCRLYA